jgi:NADH-quinone oxidoreductase subunit L
MGTEERWRAIPAHQDEHGSDHDTDHDAHHELDANHTPHEVPVSMWLPLVILAALSIFGGYLMAKGNAFEHWLYPQDLSVLGKVSTEPSNIPLAMYSTIAAVGGILLGLAFYIKGLPKNQGFDESKWSSLRTAERDQFGYDQAVTVAAVQGGGDIARGLWHWIDDGFIDKLVEGSGVVSGGIGQALKSWQTGYIRMYALMMLSGLVGIVIYFTVVLNQVGH